MNWLVDGVSNVDVGSNITLLSTPTLESIQEFKIITSSYAAEWPRSGGGVVNIVTKGGTQKFSGTAYEFFRDDKLNANTCFRTASTEPDAQQRPPKLDYNNFGYTDRRPASAGRQKAFFFFSQEWRRITRAPAIVDGNSRQPGVADRSDQRELRGAGESRSECRPAARRSGRRRISASISSSTPFPTSTTRARKSCGSTSTSTRTGSWSAATRTT